MEKALIGILISISLIAVVNMWFAFRLYTLSKKIDKKDKKRNLKG